MVVAEQHFERIGVRTDDGDFLDSLPERQNIVFILMRTMDSLAALSANSRCGGIVSRERDAGVGTISGGSNIPSRNRASKRRFTALSILSASLMSPFWTAGIAPCIHSRRSGRCPP